MATIRHEQLIAVSADTAWAALKCVERAYPLFAPVLVDCSMEGDVRIVRFANGLVASERIITVDDADRRVAYLVMGDMFDHHSASMQIVPIDGSQCRFIWISDFLPADRAEVVQPLVIEGSNALARNIEAEASRAL